MSHVLRSLIVPSLVLVVATATHAGQVDLRNRPGNIEQGPFGRANTTLYAQSVIADDVNFDMAGVKVRSFSNSPVLFNFLITGARADLGGGFGFAPDLTQVFFSSGQLSADSTGTFFLVHPNLGVTIGERLFIVLDALSYPASGKGGVEATQFNAATNPYPNNEFVFYNTSPVDTFATVNAGTWEHRGPFNENLAILADFNGLTVGTPEPSTFIGFASIGLFGLVMRLRRRD